MATSRKLFVVERCCPRAQVVTNPANGPDAKPRRPGCPNAYNERTPGAGYAVDWRCGASKPGKDGKHRMIAGYVEWDSELPKDGEFPDWCPLFEAEPGMYESPPPPTKKKKNV